MNQNPGRRIDDYLDGTLTEVQEGELNSWIKASPENAAAFADRIRFHDLLRNILRSGLSSGKEEGSPGPRSFARANPSWRRVGAVGVLVGVAIWLFGSWAIHPPRAGAATELNRLIDRATDAGDRTYFIRNLDGWPELTEERRPPIDGATLHVGPPDRYVLIRKFPDGRAFVTGSDGENGWAVPPDGAVRVSGDPMRFRGPVPGHQHGIPFADLRSDLIQLRDTYAVSPLGADSDVYRGLLAIKKSIRYRGPNRVELWYDPRTGVIQRMVFAGMPKARGGPDSVAVELVDRRRLGDEFFRHGAHHGPDRRVVEED